MRTAYEYWQGTSFAPFDFGFGPPYVRVETGTVEADSPLAAAEQLFHRHNTDDRPRGGAIRSMSVGDVVVIDGEAYRCETVGFAPWPGFAEAEHIEGGPPEGPAPRR